MPKTTRTALLAAALAFGASTAAQAQDQETGEVVLDRPVRREARVEPAPRRALSEPGPLRVYGGFSVAVGGDWQGESEGRFGFDREYAYDLDPTLGLQGGVEYVVMDYFSIGGEMRFLFPKVDGESDRHFLWDISVKPKGRYAFDNMPLEVYGAFPLGLTVPGIDGPAEGTVGFNLGLVGGATWWFNENMGVNAELGWVFHKFGVEYDDDDSEIDVKMNQFLLLCPNFVYAL
jgi:hypothetical protein